MRTTAPWKMIFNVMLILLVSPRLEISLNQMSNPEVLYFSEKQILSDAISANDSIIVRHTRRTDVLFVHRSTFGYTIGML